MKNSILRQKFFWKIFLVKVRSPSPIVNQVVENQANQVENSASPKEVLEKELEILDVVEDEVSPILPPVVQSVEPVEVEKVEKVPSPQPPKPHVVF